MGENHQTIIRFRMAGPRIFRDMTPNLAFRVSLIFSMVVSLPPKNQQKDSREGFYAGQGNQGGSPLKCFYLPTKVGTPRTANRAIYNNPLVQWYFPWVFYWVIQKT